MSLADEYKRQAAWRPWAQLFGALPPVAGQRILDVGCGVGDQAAELVSRGAHVIGLDANEELLREARERGLAGAEFRSCDLAGPLEAGEVDGIWCSFAAAYFVDLASVLARWAKSLRPGGWIALTEIDDLFGHEPLDVGTRARFDAYAREALSAGRYDFHMGSKLEAHLGRAGFTVTAAFAAPDLELSFDGPALPEVIWAWRARLERMQLLRAHCGEAFEETRDAFLSCLSHPDHRARATVRFCLARLRP
jgi:SAM-dependent methyltransferase